MPSTALACTKFGFNYSCHKLGISDGSEEGGGSDDAKPDGTEGGKQQADADADTAADSDADTAAKATVGDQSDQSAQQQA